ANTNANRDGNKKANANNNSNSNSNSNSNTDSNRNSNTNSSDDEAAKQITGARKDIDVLTSTYEGFGFTPLSWQQAYFFYKSLGGYTPRRNAAGTILNKQGEEIAPNCVDE